MEETEKEEVNDWISTPNSKRVIEPNRKGFWNYVAPMGDWRCVYRDLVGKPEGKGPL